MTVGFIHSTRLVLAPIELEESGSGFEIGRYRVRPEA